MSGCTCEGDAGTHQYPQTRALSATGSERQVGSYAQLNDSAMDTFLKSQIATHKQLERIARQTYDTSRPVDEYAGLNSPPPAAGVSWLAEYALAERIESITASLPIGITAATLQLGQRYIQLYAGAATTVQTLVSLQDMGLILNESDNRSLVFTGVPTTGCYISLAGYCLERYGMR